MIRQLMARLAAVREHADTGGGAPTMMVPAGARIDRDSSDRLCIRTPGSLVLEGSGTYGELEAVAGSIRIEAGARVEATSVRCGETCSVAGTLTAWKITARELHVEQGAQASFVLRDTKLLRIAEGGRVVGNFDSEGELVGLLARFAPEVRSLPVAQGEPIAVPASVERLTERPVLLGLAAARSLVGSARHGEAGARGRILAELEALLAASDTDALRATWRVLFDRLGPLDPQLLAARAHLAEVFGEVGAGTE